MTIRIRGLLALLVGAWVAHLAIWSPLETVERGAEVTMYDKSALFAPMTLLFGLGFPLGGTRFQQWIYNDNPDSTLGKVSAATGGSVVLRPQQQLRSNAYA